MMSLHRIRFMFCWHFLRTTTDDTIGYSRDGCNMTEKDRAVYAVPVPRSDALSPSASPAARGGGAPPAGAAGPARRAHGAHRRQTSLRQSSDAHARAGLSGVRGAMTQLDGAAPRRDATARAQSPTRLRPRRLRARHALRRSHPAGGRDSALAAHRRGRRDVGGRGLGSAATWPAQVSTSAKGQRDHPPQPP
jgi:hypothetical protein